MQRTESPTARRPHRNPEQWRTIVNRFEKSGLKIKDFCRQENLALATFSKWRSRFRDKPSQPGFVELQPSTIPSPTSESWSLQIDLPGGGHLRIQVGQ